MIVDEDLANRQRTLWITTCSMNVEPRRADKRRATPPAVVRVRPVFNVCIDDPAEAPGRAGNYGRKTIDLIPTVHPGTNAIKIPTRESAHGPCVIDDQFVAEDAVDNSSIA